MNESTKIPKEKKESGFGCLVLFVILLIGGFVWRYYHTQQLLKHPKFVVGKVTYNGVKGRTHYEYQAHDSQTYSGTKDRIGIEVDAPVLVVYDSLNPGFSRFVRIPVWDLKYGTTLDSIYNADALDTLPITWY